MSKEQNIFLVGPMGAGKSTIGKALSELTSREFLDSYTVIEERTGADIAWVFDVEGEEGFRKREEAVIEDLTNMHGIILATGGGVVKNANNRKNLAARGVVVYLETSPEVQYERTKRDRKRPLLNNENPYETLKNLLKERDPLYREISDIIIKTDDYNAHQAAQLILDKIEEL